MDVFWLAVGLAFFAGSIGLIGLFQFLMTED